MPTAIWRNAKKFLSPRMVCDALWMDEPLYVVFRNYFHPFNWNPTAVYVWLMGALVTLRLRTMRIGSYFGVPIPPDTSRPTGPLMLNRSWRRWRGVSAARPAKKTRRVIIQKPRPASKLRASARPVSWLTRWQRRYQLHLVRIKHAAWIAQNLFE